ncbi:MAG: alpha/beta hydrolase [Halobacteriales archaeon SW_9_67_25]|nr:MAG: alpha/beta hydrolase [Halobacteriales archaeon SW_9_67_25]
MDLRAHDIEARDGTTLNCWEYSPDGAGEAVLFVHGAITNARALFATPVEGDDSYSWLRAAAERGRAAFALDIRGYGHSDLPPEMDEPPEANGPPVRADQAADDIADALGFVRERQGGDEAVFETVWRAQIDSNQGRDETTYVAQTGALADWAASARGEPVCDPAAIDAPTLVVRGSADEIADRPGTIEYYDDLDAPGDRADYVEIQGADHYLMHSDRRRDFFRTVHDFQTRVG